MKPAKEDDRQAQNNSYNILEVLTTGDQFEVSFMLIIAAWEHPGQLSHGHHLRQFTYSIASVNRQIRPRNHLVE